MKQLLLFLLLFSVSPVFAENAMPFCTKMVTRIYVRAKPGNPQYITQYSKEDFLKKAKAKLSPYTLGLTVSKPDVSIQTKPSILKQLDQICVGLEEIDVELGYKELTVYIDKKYAPSSCEYKTIKEHENYHVEVANQALSFFRPDVENVVSQAISQLSPKVVTSQDEIQPTVNKFASTLLKEIQPVIAHINKKLSEKNAAIDTPEMYQATTAVCKNW